MWLDVREQTQLSISLITKLVLKDIKMQFFKGYFLSTVQENQYAKLKKNVTEKPRCTHVGLALLLTHA